MDMTLLTEKEGERGVCEVGVYGGVNDMSCLCVGTGG